MKKAFLGICILMSTMAFAQKDIILASSKYSEVVSNFESKLGKLDFALSQIREVSGLHITIVPFTKDDDGKVPGMVVFLSNPKDCIMGMVYDYSDLVLEDNKFSSGSYTMQLTNGYEFAAIHSNKGEISFEDKFNIDDFGGLTERSSLPRFVGICVTQCYKKWKDGCEADPVCSTFCDFFPCGSFELYDCAVQCLKHYFD